MRQTKVGKGAKKPVNPPNSDGKGPGTPTGANGPKPETGKPRNRQA